jgi:NAD(P)-dependent dehydrogenase (short-subunit alcohol dehydrogenase family)
MGKNVLITGCSSGIGRATAERFASSGYRVYASMRDPAKGEELRVLADENAWDLSTPQLDVTDERSVRDAVGRIEAEAGQIDILVNNAGLGMLAPVEDVADEELRRLFETNVFGTVRVTRAVVPSMRERGEGTIVTVSSFGATLVFPYYSFYHATKWAVEAITEGLYMELRPYGVKVYSVMPGLVASGFGANTIRAQRVADKETAYRDDIKALVAGFMELLPGNRVEPDSPAAKILEVVEGGSDQLHHPSDPYAAAEMQKRKEMSEHEWLAHFREMLQI